MVAEVFRIAVPEYNIDKKPNYMKIGNRVDRFIEKNFSDGKYVVRAIGSQDHPELALKDLINIIKEKGTDKYDKNRVGIFEEEFSGYSHDIQAGVTEIKDSKIIPGKYDDYPSLFGDIIYHFYEHAPIDRGYPVRIDILLIYDFKKLKKGKFLGEGEKMRQELADCLWKFKDELNKQEALVGIVVIGR
ncbi:hypothetical protein HNV12_00140 [Methanococcoides sp. SA1]|nr:hypothetical protein [Methanococcoides sp. SA1]